MTVLEARGYAVVGFDRSEVDISHQLNPERRRQPESLLRQTGPVIQGPTCFAHPRRKIRRSYPLGRAGDGLPVESDRLGISRCFARLLHAVTGQARSKAKAPSLTFLDGMLALDLSPERITDGRGPQVPRPGFRSALASNSSTDMWSLAASSAARLYKSSGTAIVLLMSPLALLSPKTGEASSPVCKLCRAGKMPNVVRNNASARPATASSSKNSSLGSGRNGRRKHHGGNEVLR
jgi:hypothetical protein